MEQIGLYRHSEALAEESEFRMLLTLEDSFVRFALSK